MLVTNPSMPSSKRFTAGPQDDEASDMLLTRSPLGYAGGDANLYRYCGNDPTNATDPSGLDWVLSGNEPPVVAGQSAGGSITVEQFGERITKFDTGGLKVELNERWRINNGSGKSVERAKWTHNNPPAQGKSKGEAMPVPVPPESPPKPGPNPPIYLNPATPDTPSPWLAPNKDGSLKTLPPSTRDKIPDLSTTGRQPVDPKTKTPRTITPNLRGTYGERHVPPSGTRPSNVPPKEKTPPNFDPSRGYSALQIYPDYYLCCYVTTVATTLC